MTDRYAVIGNPIAQSRSPIIHRMFANAAAHELEYVALLSDSESFERDVRAFAAAGGRGMNVTMPFKLQAHQLCDSRSRAATLAGAVNALRFDDGCISGENFDGVGLVDDIVRNLNTPIAGRRVLLLGAGGAARGAAFALHDAGPALLRIVNRSAEKAHSLADAVRQAAAVREADTVRQAQATCAGIEAGGLAELGEGGFDIVVNATASSMGGADAAAPPVVAAAVFAHAALAYDMVYGKGLTPFLAAARNGGARHVADGVGMLVEQAALSFAWWRGTRVDTAAVIDALRVPL